MPHVQASIGDCCASCTIASGCNAFHFCSTAGGCIFPEGKMQPAGACTLLQSSEVRGGQPASYADFSAVTVPISSGYVLKA
jgi:hypothetical protein